MSDDINDRVSRAEREIDDYFDRELKIQGIYRPALIEALLDVAEKLVTGHRAPGDKYDAAIRALHVNVVDGLNWSLRRARRLGSDDRRSIPNDLDRIANGCISDGMAYPFVESAFYSFWKGYATVSFPTEKEILFTPTGGVLDARLRRHLSKDGIERETKPTKENPLLDPSSPVAEKFVKSLLERSSVQEIGGFIWDVDPDVIREVAEIMSEFFTYRVDDTEIGAGGVSLSGLVKGVSIVCTVSQIHSLVSILMSKDPTDVSTSVNWATLSRRKRDWLRWFGLLGADEHVLSALTFDAEDKTGDVAITPLVPIDGEYLGVVPSLAMRSNWPRHILVLLAKKFGTAYSVYSASKEDRLLAAFRESHGDLVVESHEVRCSQDPGDGGSTAEARVGTMPVVVMEPEGQRATPLVGVTVQARISPLEQRGLDETLDLAVGARGIGPGEDMAQAEPLTGRPEAPRAIPGAVVRHDGRHAHPEPAQAPHRALEKARRGAPAFIGQDLAEGHARGIVDGHMAELPAGPLHGVPAIAGEPVPRTDDPPQLLRVQVQQLAGMGPLVAPRGRRQLQHVQARPATAPHDARDRRPTHGHLRGNLATRPPLLVPQDLDAQDHRRGRRLRAVLGAGAAIREALARRGARHPLPDRGVGGVQGPGDLPRGVAQLPHSPDGFLSTSQRQSGILVDVHPGILLSVLECLAASSFVETPRMDNPPATNLVRLHS